MEVVDGELNVFSRDLYRVYIGLVGVINHTNYRWSPGWEKEVNIGRIRDVYGRKVSLYFTAFVCSAVCASAELCVFAVTLPSFLPSSRLLRLLACTLAHAMWQSQTESRQAGLQTEARLWAVSPLSSFQTPARGRQSHRQSPWSLQAWVTRRYPKTLFIPSSERLIFVCALGECHSCVLLLCARVCGDICVQVFVSH